MRPAARTRTGNVVSFIILSYQRRKSYPLFPQNPAETLVELFGSMYGDNVIEKHGINRDRTGDREKTRYLCGKQGIFTRDRALIRPGSIRQLETRASTRSASFFMPWEALGGPTTAAALLGHIVPTTGRNP